MSDGTEDQERREALQVVEQWLETPMLLLGFVWLVLFILELVYGLNRVLVGLGLAIWILFVLEFALRLALAPDKLSYLGKSWLTLIALAVPALRIMRVARLAALIRTASAARGIRLVRLITSLNRGINSVRRGARSKGAGYVLALTVMVTLTGAAGMYAFEGDARADGHFLSSYGEALWWTAMIMTTMGSEWWPRTLEGRLLCILLSLYAFAMFGYVTATLASFFIGQERRERADRDNDAKVIAQRGPIDSG